ncbi:unnamed protein product [Peronospora belbahrii]|uniref:Uncharacterized protein n=1 Tax=Peronospora belbahrii TaxID=622444 RepID=A0ABN8D4Z7_9STRA|nr:unnamed protein product [Peronospora belbahrii]
MEECQLLNGEFAAFLQVLLGLIAFSVLILKRFYETPQRPLLIWAFDATKQMIGATFAHIANLFIAILLYATQEEKNPIQDKKSHEEEPVDQCALYFVNFTLDTTFGVFLNYILLSALILVAHRWHWSALQIPGDYGTPIQVRIWFLQVCSWILVIFACKFLIAIVIVTFQTPLGRFAMILLKPLKHYPKIELVLVMIACPCLMNAMQLWIQDNYLKKDVRDESFLIAQAPLSPTNSLNEEKEKLPNLGTPMDDKSSEPGEGGGKLCVGKVEEHDKIKNKEEKAGTIKKQLQLDLTSLETNLNV